jgi:processive 1,2-diacylglycerol beta-glucosyltransferase
MDQSLFSKRILFLSSDYGYGHNQVAKAIQEALKISYPHSESIYVDFMKWMHPYTHFFGRALFLHIMKKAPKVYGYLYNKTRDTQYSLSLRLFNQLSARRLQRLLATVEPDIVISTFPLAAAAMAFLKKAGLTHVPLITVITDHSDHGFWVHCDTDYFIVGSDKVQQGLVRRGIDQKQIIITGIPVRPKFNPKTSRHTIRKKQPRNHPSKFTILIMGGGYGIFDKVLLDILLEIELTTPVEWVIICGQNDKLKEYLLERTKQCGQKVVVEGYVDNIHEYMLMADLLITKPGGVTTSEALAMELPMLLYNPLPGQEEDNTTFLLENKVAILAEDIFDLKKKIMEVVNNPLLLLSLKDNIRCLNTNQAAFKVAEVIMNIH